VVNAILYIASTPAPMAAIAARALVGQIPQEGSEALEHNHDEQDTE